MADTIDIATDRYQNDIDRITQPRLGLVAVVWVQNGHRHHTVLPGTTPRKAKDRLEEEAGVDLLTNRWSVASYVDDVSLDIHSSGHSALKQDAEKTLRDYVPTDVPVDLYDLLIEAEAKAKKAKATS